MKKAEFAFGSLVHRRSRRGLHVNVRGQGPPLVLLHGWCLSGRMWAYQEAALIGSRTVICPDLAGFGHSCALAPPYSLDRLADDVADLLDELEVEDVVLGGFAFGACVAMQLAATRPERVGCLVLVGVPSGATAPYDRMGRAIRRDWPEFARRSARAICKQPHSDATFDWLESIFVATPIPVALETVGVLGSFDPLELAPRVGVRTRYVHGREDDVVPLAVAEACATASPAATVDVVDDSGHLVPLDQPDTLTAVLTGVRR